MADIQINQRPIFQPSNGQAPRLAVAAQVGSYQSAAAAPNADLQGLLQGLSAFNPALAAFHQAAQAEQELQSRTDAQGRQEASVIGAAEAEKASVDSLSGAPVVVPDNIPPAYGQAFRESFLKGVGQRQGLLNKQEAIDEFTANQRDPAFMAGVESGQWGSEKLAKAVGGITDPAQVAIVGGHMREMNTEIAGLLRSKLHAKREAAVQANVAALTSGTFTANMTPEQMAAAVPAYMGWMTSQGVTDAEAGRGLFNHLNAMSVRGGGMPGVLDVLESKQENGTSLLDRFPDLLPAFTSARHQASQQADKAVEDAAMGSRALRLRDFTKAAEDGSLTDEQVFHNTGPGHVFTSAEQGASLLARRDAARAEKAAAVQLDSTYDNGTLGGVEPKMQSAVLEKRLGGAVTALFESKEGGPQPQPTEAITLRAGVLAIGLAQAHSASGATVPLAGLKRYIETTVTNLPSAGGPPPAFIASVELYKALSAYPQYRSMYFDEKASNLMADYIEATQDGKSDPKAAYIGAFEARDPKRVQAAEHRLADPDFKTKLKDIAIKAVEGSSIFPTWIGGNGRPSNTEYVEREASWALGSYYRRNPTATDAQAKEYATGWIAGHTVLDTTSQAVVMVPQGMGGPQTQRVISEYSASLVKRHGLDQLGDGWQVQYIPTGTAGEYQATAWNGMQHKMLGPVSLQDLFQKDAESKVLSAAERAQIGAYFKPGAAGGAKGGTYAANPAAPLPPELFAKAQALRVISPQQVAAYQGAMREAYMGRLNSVPQVAMGDPAAGLAQPPARGTAIVSNQQTAEAAMRMLTSPMYSAGSQHMALAASAITAGEGVALRAYDDPARGAGKNIGTGYNLTANAAHLAADLRAAGITDPKVVEAVKAGTAELTPQQNDRLLLAALPRYEKQVQEVAESSAPGLWNRMAPQQKAVMLDIAWQTGDPAKFKKAWAALAANDAAGFAAETKVFYTNKAGERVEDTRRGGLRASMLAGLDRWAATVQKMGSYPSTRLEALGAR